MRETKKTRKFPVKIIPLFDGDYEGLLDRLLRFDKYGYKGKPKSLITSFIYWTENHPSKSKVFTKSKYRQRAEQLKARIFESNDYPNNYIRALDRYGMLDVINLFTSF
jgi:hypothetical protein